jgi:rod shape-determining protein MreD
MRPAVFTVLAVLTAVVLQTAVLDRLPFPGGFPPDLVLVLVVTLALAGGPLAGTVIGFGAGLALDIAPPAAGLLGLNALVFCAVGYGCGRLRGPMERSAWLPLAVVAVAATVGEILYALAGLTLGDPDISWQSMRQVLPPVIVYSILISPFVLYLVVRFGGFGGWASAGARGPGLLTGSALARLRLLGAPAAGSAGLAATGAAVRDTRTGREPPRLRVRGGVAGSAAGGAMGAGRAPARPVHLRLGAPRRGDGKLAGSPGRGQLSLTGAARPGRAAGLGKNAFRSAGPGPGLAASRPGHQPGPRSFRGGPSALAAAGSTSRPVRLRLRSRRRDGVLGGSVLGPGPRTAGGGGVPGAAFSSRRAPGAAGALRSGRGRGAVPRFRAGRGIFRFGAGGLPGGRRGSLRGSALAPRQRRFGWKGRGAAGGLGGKSRRGGGLRLPGKRTGGQP